MGGLRRFIALVVLGVAACAPAPERPDAGGRFEYRTAHSPYAAAICIARNARGRSGLSAEERTVGQSSTEVVVRSAAGDTLAVARVDNVGTFSQAVVQVMPHARTDRAAFARDLMAGC